MNNQTVKILSIAVMATIAALLVGYFFGAYGVTDIAAQKSAVVVLGCSLLSYIGKDFACQALDIEPEYFD